jgi:hypothetical protein
VATDLEKWADRQVRAAVARGINPLDAEKAVKDFLKLLPPGADPDTYVVPAYQLEQNLALQVDDARASWFSDVDPRFARILDAMESDE